MDHKVRSKDIEYLKAQAISCQACRSTKWELAPGAYVEHCGGSPATQIRCSDCGQERDVNVE